MAVLETLSLETQEKEEDDEQRRMGQEKTQLKS
jgi:hypothetical protein